MYPGGKRRMLPCIRPLRPANFKRYHEVCAGGLAHFIDLRSSGFAGHSYIYDANEELIRTYRAIRADPEAVAAAYRLHAAAHSELYFRRVKRVLWRPMPDADVAGRMLYLNRTCYNALYRIDRRGRFVVGAGHDRSGNQCHRLDVENLRAFSRALRDAELMAADFTAVMSRALRGDFVFIDPPYPDGFSDYTAVGFTDGDHRRLRDVCGELDRMGVMFMQTNADCELVRELYRGFRIFQVESKRMSKNAWGGGIARDVVIANYSESGQTISNGVGGIADGGVAGSLEGGTRSMASEGCVTVIDKFTGDIRAGGSELIDEVFGRQAKERDMFISSDNPSYLIGRVRQNEGAFDAVEIKQMLDATFDCACRGSPDAWYPNQYALGLVDAIREAAGNDVGYFLSNFELGLRMSGERAARHLGKGDWLKESRQLAARLNHPDALDQLTDADYRDIVAHVTGHPRYAAAMAWHEKESGKQMRGKESAGAGEPPPTEEAAHDLLMVAGIGVLKVNRDEVVRMDLTSPLRKLRGLMSSAATVAAAKGKLGLVFSGWESDPRELYGIAEVRAYFAALDREFPYWLWFLMQGQITLSLLLLCPLGKVETDGRNAGSHIDAPALKAWYFRHTDALIELAQKHGLDKAQVVELFKGFTEMMETCAKQT